ncbi:MAG: response regulator [Pseudomonadota bacterium]
MTAAPQSSAEESASPRRVLLVDDNEANLMVAEAQLTFMGYEVDIARNGQQAIDQFSSSAHDAVLMDIQMPVMDGFEASSHMREVLCDTTTPIIAVSAGAAAVNATAAEEHGMNGFVQKPVDWGLLRAMLEETFDQS